MLLPSATELLRFLAFLKSRIAVSRSSGIPLLSSSLISSNPQCYIPNPRFTRTFVLRLMNGCSTSIMYDWISIVFLEQLANLVLTHVVLTHVVLTRKNIFGLNTLYRCRCSLLAVLTSVHKNECS